MRKLTIKEYFVLIFIILYYYQLLGKRLIENQNYLNIIGLIFLIFIFFVLYPKSLVKTISKTKYIFLVLFMLYILITGFLSYDFLSTIKYIIGTFIILSPIFIADFTSQIVNKRFHKILLNSSILIFVYYSLMNNYYISIFPNIARQLASGSDTLMNYYYGINIGGGYSLIYGLVFLVVSVFAIKNFSLFYSFVLFSIFAYTIYISGYFIALLQMFIGIILYLIFSKHKNIRVLYGFTLTVFAFLLIILRVQVGNLLISTFENSNSIFSEKIIEIGNLISGNDVYEFINVDARISRIVLSFNSFLNRPLFGYGVVTGYNSISERGIIGQHSEWIDMLARYGIIGTFIFVTLLIHSAKDIKYSTNYISVIILFVLLGFVNPIINSSIFFSVFFISKSIENYNKLNYQ